jgi:hypothetical protein
MKRLTYFESTESRIRINVGLCHWSIVSGVHLPLDKGKIQRNELHVAGLHRAGIFKKSMGARHRGGIGFSYRPARLHRLAEFIPWNQCRGPINIYKYGL